MNENDVMQNIETFGPDAILIVSFKEGTSVNGTIATAVLDAILFEKDLKTVIWRANVQGSGWDSFTDWRAAGKSVAENIFGKLDEDGILKLKYKIKSTPTQSQYR